MNPIPNGYVTPPGQQPPIDQGAIYGHHNQQPPSPAVIFNAIQILHLQPVQQVLFPDDPYATPPRTPTLRNEHVNAPVKPKRSVDTDLQNRSASAAKRLFEPQTP